MGRGIRWTTFNGFNDCYRIMWRVPQMEWDSLVAGLNPEEAQASPPTPSTPSFAPSRLFSGTLAACGYLSCGQKPVHSLGRYGIREGRLDKPVDGS